MIGVPEILEDPKFIAAYEIKGEPSWSKTLNEKKQSTDIFFVQDGSGQCVIGEMIFTVARGDIVIFPTLSSYEIISSVQTPISGIVISISNVQISGMPKGYLTSPDQCPVIPTDKDYSSTSRYFSEIYSEYQHPTYGSNEMIESLTRTILIVTIRKLYLVKPKISPSITHEVKKYIEEYYYQDLTLSDLAAIVYVSPYHLAHIYKEEMGTPPIQYLIQCRIDEAKRLLKYTNLTIREIALKVGYPNGIYFNLLFKKLTGIPPGKFRKIFSE
ncbi:AraC family transcriptional regulator [Paenibacillus validus]|uniref:AraC family transcriptional regulator n=1 Tax=Paenibacillus TaxID=44249 RepID=UPI000FD908C2|nr:MULTISPECIES: AraC family transcriptional regulator [Paenibacillus]MED4599236.1 AraC family transcriptional regulator [Paenibacillus validus]MED4606457.1 AraC family transcriptional regulator [Paenibacillus validus]